MSMTNACRWIATRSKPSASGPTGFGASYVPCSAHRRCHPVSIDSANAAVYRNGGTSAAGSPVCAPVVIGGLLCLGFGCLLRTNEKPLLSVHESLRDRRGIPGGCRGVAALSSCRSARPDKEESMHRHGPRIRHGRDRRTTCEQVRAPRPPSVAAGRGGT